MFLNSFYIYFKSILKTRTYITKIIFIIKIIFSENSNITLKKITLYNDSTARSFLGQEYIYVNRNIIDFVSIILLTLKLFLIV